MHEMGLAQNILDIVLRTASSNGARRVVRVKIRAGRLRAIVPDQLRFCFDFVAKDSLAEGAELAVQIVPIRTRCRGCAAEFEVEPVRFVCPGCGGEELDILQGKELLVENIEIL